VAAHVTNVRAHDLTDHQLKHHKTENNLTITKNLNNDPINNRLEAHIKHPINLIDDQNLDPIKNKDTTIEQILKPTKHNNNNINTYSTLNLLLKTNSTINKNNQQNTNNHDHPQLVDNLHRKLPNQNKHKHHRAPHINLDQINKQDTKNEHLTQTNQQLNKNIITTKNINNHKLLNNKRHNYPTLKKNIHNKTRYTKINET